MTIQALGWWLNGKFKPLDDDISSVGYWYQTEPHAKFPEMPDITGRCPRKNRDAALHEHGQKLMSFGTPEEIDSAVVKARRTFGNENGGIFYHAEIDSGFPFENVEALLRAFQKYK